MVKNVVLLQAVRGTWQTFRGALESTDRHLADICKDMGEDREARELYKGKMRIIEKIDVEENEMVAKRSNNQVFTDTLKNSAKP